MKPPQMYQELRDLAEKLDIQVLDQNLKKAGVYVKSGFCRVKGKKLFIMDKHLPDPDKVEILALFLAEQPLPLSALGDQFGVSRERVRQLAERTRKKLQTRLRRRGFC